jgi:hypothetical protein
MALKPIQPLVEWILEALSAVIKWPEREADQSLTFSIEVRSA